MVEEESTFRALVKAALCDAIGTDPSVPRDPSAVVSEATRRLLPVLRDSHAHARVVLNAYVKGVYGQTVHAGRKAASAIEEEAAQGQAALPGWDDLLAWRHPIDDGTEIAIAFATLAQVDVFVSRYAKLVRENDAKRRHLVALSERMRAAGFEPHQTVEEFYRAQPA